MKPFHLLCAIAALTLTLDASAVSSHTTNWSLTKAAPSVVESGNDALWNVETEDGLNLFANTKGDRGALGQYCNAGEGACAWLIVLRNTTCEEGEQHPVLVNTDTSASSHMIQCIGTLDHVGSAFAFVDFESFDAVIRRGRIVAIAIPEQDDAIAVAHFRLDGAVGALERMRARVVAKANVD